MPPETTPSSSMALDVLSMVPFLVRLGKLTTPLEDPEDEAGLFMESSRTVPGAL